MRWGASSTRSSFCRRVPWRTPYSSGTWWYERRSWGERRTCCDRLNKKIPTKLAHKAWEWHFCGLFLFEINFILNAYYYSNIKWWVINLIRLLGILVLSLPGANLTPNQTLIGMHPWWMTCKLDTCSFFFLKIKKSWNHKKTNYKSLYLQTGCKSSIFFSWGKKKLKIACKLCPNNAAYICMKFHLKLRPWWGGFRTIIGQQLLLSCDVKMNRLRSSPRKLFFNFLFLLLLGIPMVYGSDITH